MEWKDLKDFNRYEANEDGEIRNKETLKILSQCSLDKDGNPTVKLYQDGVRKKICVHRIIGELFVPNPDNLPFLKRKDNDKLNVRASNLYWTDKYI